MTTVETERVEWQLLGACRGKNQDLFFPYDTGTGKYDWEPARKICAECDVRETCLEWALANVPHAETGLWGGLTPDERQKLKRQRLARRRENRGRLST